MLVHRGVQHLGKPTETQEVDSLGLMSVLVLVTNRDKETFEGHFVVARWDSTGTRRFRFCLFICGWGNKDQVILPVGNIEFSIINAKL